MPLFSTPKPRQFHYRPRFYNPEKERWEALKQKYADEQAAEQYLSQQPTSDTTGLDDPDLEYFQQRLRQIDQEQRQKQRGLTWKDLFRKREMPTFNYQPRFNTTADQPQDTAQRLAEYKERNLKIKRRFDISDPEYLKPVPATRILLYVALVCLLLYWILF